MWTSPSPRIVMIVEVGKSHPPLAFAVTPDGAVVGKQALPAAGHAVLALPRLPR